MSPLRVLFFGTPAFAVPTLDALLASPGDAIPSLVLQVIFLHMENTYFSQKWWESLERC